MVLTNVAAVALQPEAVNVNIQIGTRSDVTRDVSGTFTVPAWPGVDRDSLSGTV